MENTSTDTTRMNETTLPKISHHSRHLEISDDVNLRYMHRSLTLFTFTENGE